MASIFQRFGIEVGWLGWVGLGFMRVCLKCVVFANPISWGINFDNCVCIIIIIIFWSLSSTLPTVCTLGGRQLLTVWDGILVQWLLPARSIGMGWRAVGSSHSSMCLTTHPFLGIQGNLSSLFFISFFFFTLPMYDTYISSMYLCEVRGKKKNILGKYMSE